MNYLIILSLTGLILSIYAIYAEARAKKDKKYRPLCDINSNISCSKAFSHKTGRLFGLHNAILGTIFYLIVAILAYINLKNYVFFISIPAVALSIYLAFISYIKMKNFCLVCTAVYVINILILVLSIWKELSFNN